jgi:hypothetical protein
MLTLKMAFASGTQWVGGIRSISELETTFLPDDFDPASGDALDHFGSLRKAGEPLEDGEEWDDRRMFPLLRAWQGTIHVGTYEPSTPVKALLVEFADGSRSDTYIVPSGGTFIMGDDGQTLDRL